MAAVEFLNKAHAAYVDEEYQEALKLYTQAVEHAGSASAFAYRAQTQLQVGNYMEAAEDAGKAIELNARMPKAHLRKAIALFYMEEYETAKTFLESGSNLDSSNPVYSIWMRKCDAELEAEDGAMEDVQIIPPAPPSVVEEAVPEQEIKENKPVTPPPCPLKYRHEWYQTSTDVLIEVFAKKLTSDRVLVKIEDRRVEIRTKENSDSGAFDYEFVVNLSDEVRPSESRFTIMSTKLEVKLKKSVLHRTWVTLEQDGLTLEEIKRLDYPTSSKRAINWEKLEAEVKQEQENAKEEGDAAVHQLFQKVYAGGDEDTRRAMIKSFQESNGTCLSTNWQEVGSKTVDPAPPDGSD